MIKTHKEKNVASTNKPPALAIVAIIVSALVPVGIIIFVAVVALSGVFNNTGSVPYAKDPSSTPQSTTQIAPTSPTPSPSLTEALTFSGLFAGQMTSALDIEPATNINPLPPLNDDFSQPAPTSTQCASFPVDSLPTNDFDAVISGTVGKDRLTLLVEVNEDQQAYTNPGSPLNPGNTNQGGSVELFKVGDSAHHWQQVIGPNGEEPATVIMSADRKSGQINAWLGDSGYSQKGADATVHIEGNWRCG